jgi:ribonuclease HII
LIGGVDETGRGPIIGPMVVAGVSIREEEHEKLLGMVERDSKKYSPRSRSRISWKARSLLEDVVVSVVPPREVDKWIFDRELGGLNALEARVMSWVIDKMSADTIYVDSCGVDAARFGETITSMTSRGARVISEHKADERYPVVSMASIIAKVLRDREVKKLSGMYGEVGSGYCSDARTIDFLKKWYEDKRIFPTFVRKSWKTIDRIVSGIE